MKKGVTLIDVLVGTSLMLIVFLGIFGAYQLGLKVVGQSKNKITATAIANEWLEKIRNLPYQSVGTKGASLPFAVGILDSVITTVRNNVEYKIETQVKFIVDEADGIGATDSCNWDYKRAEIKVSWSGRFAGKVKLVTDIAPKDKIQEIQTCQVQPGGILSVTVFNAYGEMVDSFLIEVFNPTTGELIVAYTPFSGKQDIPLAISTYKVVVSKEGYSSERTFGSGEIYNGKTVITPEKPHPIVLEGQLTEISFSIDKLSSFSVDTLSVQEEEGEDSFPIPNVTFTLKGTKIVGLDADENPICKYWQNHISDSAGRKDILNLEWDNYTFSVDPATGLDLVETDPSPQPISLSPNTTQSVKLYLDAENSLLVTVQNKETGESIFSATVRLYNLDLDYDKTQYTNEKGQSYFIPLQLADYNLEVQAPGYLTASTTVSVSGDVTKTIKLEQLE